MKPQVIILMGSPADMDHSNKIAEAARVFALDVEVRVGSAHRTPEHVLGLIREYEANGRPKVYGPSSDCTSHCVPTTKR
jgi:5-(carboxyamino)imidazole ribonucleotide mutase/phosphoribosylaminoimidazole-succinocarboxamide synthase